MHWYFALILQNVTQENQMYLNIWVKECMPEVILLLCTDSTSKYGGQFSFSCTFDFKLKLISPQACGNNSTFVKAVANVFILFSNSLFQLLIFWLCVY